MSIAKQLFGPDGKPVLRDGRIVHRLLRIGCRVYAKQHHLAASIGRDRKVVNARLMLMREHGIVWRVADGWLELNPHLVWCGPIAHRTGYLDWLAATGQQLPPMLTGQVGEGSDE